jgi:hypothetical protein
MSAVWAHFGAWAQVTIHSLSASKKFARHSPLLVCTTTGKFLASNILGGVLQCLISLLIGLIPPTSVGWYAMLVKAHVLFMFNGFLAMHAVDRSARRLASRLSADADEGVGADDAVGYLV